MTIGECNMKEDTTIEMTLRLQGRMKNDESTTSVWIAEDRKDKTNHQIHVVK